MEDIVLRVAVGVKNDALSKEVPDEMAEIISNRIEETVLKLVWVTDIVIMKES